MMYTSEMDLSKRGGQTYSLVVYFDITGQYSPQTHSSPAEYPALEISSVEGRLEALESGPFEVLDEGDFSPAEWALLIEYGWDHAREQAKQ